jgi:hypothetical protein
MSPVVNSHNKVDSGCSPFPNLKNVRFYFEADTISRFVPFIHNRLESIDLLCNNFITWTDFQHLLMCCPLLRQLSAWMADPTPPRPPFPKGSANSSKHGLETLTLAFADVTMVPGVFERFYLPYLSSLSISSPSTGTLLPGNLFSHLQPVDRTSPTNGPESGSAVFPSSINGLSGLTEAKISRMHWHGWDIISRLLNETLPLSVLKLFEPIDYLAMCQTPKKTPALPIFLKSPTTLDITTFEEIHSISAIMRVVNLAETRHLMVFYASTRDESTSLDLEGLEREAPGLLTIYVAAGSITRAINLAVQLALHFHRGGLKRVEATHSGEVGWTLSSRDCESSSSICNCAAHLSKLEINPGDLHRDVIWEGWHLPGLLQLMQDVEELDVLLFSPKNPLTQLRQALRGLCLCLSQTNTTLPNLKHIHIRMTCGKLCPLGAISVNRFRIWFAELFRLRQQRDHPLDDIRLTVDGEEHVFYT